MYRKKDGRIDRKNGWMDGYKKIDEKIDDSDSIFRRTLLAYYAEGKDGWMDRKDRWMFGCIKK